MYIKNLGHKDIPKGYEIMNLSWFSNLFPIEELTQFLRLRLLVPDFFLVLSSLSAC